MFSLNNLKNVPFPKSLLSSPVPWRVGRAVGGVKEGGAEELLSMSSVVQG